MNRRHFLLSSAAAAGAAWSAPKSANDTVRIGCVGLRGRGKSHLHAFTTLPNVDLVAVCDVDESVLNAAAKDVENKRQKAPAAYTDIRKMLEDKSIDAISIATPNHHHTLQTIWACQAGKDVYVEKPCSHNMFEARQIVAAARKYDRIVQQGSQSRSSVALREAVQKMREGAIGDLYMARGLCYKWRKSIGHTPEEPVPAGVHYDLWLGPAPQHAFTKNRFHYNWHWFWDYGNGDLGNQGIHEVDIARWGLGVKYPTKVSAIGGHFMFDDDQETPNTINCAYEFNDNGKKKMMTFEVRHWMTNHEAGINEFDKSSKSNTIGNIFYGSNGYLAIDGYDRYQSWIGKDQEPGPANKAGGDHFANFINAVRSHKREDLTAEIEEGAASTTLVHLANISYRLGRTLNFDSEKWACTGDAEATHMFTRNYRAPFVVPELA
ncbi:MAG TPA: Gfo/Idh/MocA family oxidoreductase [Bryobacteraceae bacterium]|nr:Gfo/Idh/MocA family oxidoreductase [Bryobacteraceae bacterium]